MTFICTITEEEEEEFKDGWGGVTPCQEYGDCEFCPFAWVEEEEEEEEK